MINYAAMIRGIGPGDPKKSNESLRSVFESLGFSNVRSVISSGNIIFTSDEKDIAKLEATVEAAWPKQLGFEATTIIRSQAQLQHILDSDPFEGIAHSEGSYQLVTFMKKPAKPAFTLPYQPEGKPYKLVSYNNGVICSTTDNTVVKTSDLMLWLEKNVSKNITSRTPLTLQRIINQMSRP